MPKDIRKDIHELENMFISIIPEKINVLVVGGGRAGYIKAKSFSEKGCNVTVVSLDFNLDIQKLSNIKTIGRAYSEKYILDKHIIVIAVSDRELAKQIKADCENNYKLYLECSNFKEGNLKLVVQEATENIAFAVSTKKGSPRTSMYLSEIVKENLISYDAFVEFSTEMRSLLKGDIRLKEIMNFISNEDFLFFFNKGKHRQVLSMFYGRDIFGA